jgi:hypothetical protein
MPEPRRTKIKTMFEGDIGSIFFSAPASSRSDFHNCFPGGLVLHSLNVVANLYKMTSTLCPDRYSIDTLAFVGLFHDLGKVGDGKNEFYKSNESEWHRSKGMLFEINKDCTFMVTAERGLFILQSYGVEMSAEEYLAIKLSDGQYDDTNRQYRLREPELALLLHWADMWSMVQEKRHDK